MAVYTELTLTELAPILDRYAIGEGVDLTPIAEGTANTNYMLNTTNGRYVCTLFELPEEAAQMVWVPEYLNHLKRAGLNVITFVADKTGNYTQFFNKKVFIISHYLRGTNAKQTVAMAQQAGTALAKLHLHSADYAAPVAQAWAPEAMADFVNAITHKDHPNYKDLMAETAWQTDNVSARLGLPQGVVHADYFPDNVLFDGPTLSGMIDFNLAGTDAFAYDLALALTAWGFDVDGNHLPKVFDAFYKGYTEARPLNKKEAAAMPTLCRRACCVVLTMRLLSLGRAQASGEGPRPPEAYAKRLAFFKDETNLSKLNFS